jgi:chemotaxis protein MotB
MKVLSKLTFLFIFGVLMTSCVSKKKLVSKQTELANLNKELGKCGIQVNELMGKLSACNKDNETLRSDLKTAQSSLQLRQEQVTDLKEQIGDIRTQRDKQVTQVGDLTLLSQSASNNIKETLSQLEKKDKYIHLLQAAKTKADSINLALAVNLKGVLSDGIEDKDVEVKVDKTVVFINLSDKMLFTSGSATITPKASEVLGKIAKIIESRPGLEVMIEGYTDNLPIKLPCFDDNWDLSTKRSTAVVRILQKTYKIDPNRLIAAGRGEYNALASNDNPDGRSINRRTRIIIMPKLDEFYDLLNPALAPK